MVKNTGAVEEIVHEALWTVATAVRDACYAAAVTAYENAKMDGLCDEGARECALSALQSLDFKAIVSKAFKPL